MIIKDSLLKFYIQTVIKENQRYFLFILLLVILSALSEVILVSLGIPLLEVGMHVDSKSQGKVLSFLHNVLASAGIVSTHEILIFALMGVMSIAALIHGTMRLIQFVGVNAVAVTLRRKIRSQLLKKILIAPYHYLVEKGRGATLYNLSLPSDSVFSVIVLMGRLLQAGFNIVALIVLMMYLSWVATMLVLFLAITAIYGWRKFSDHRILNIGRKLYQSASQMNKIEVDAIDGIKMVKSQGLFCKILLRQDSFLKEQMLLNIKQAFLSNGSGLVMELMGCVFALAFGSTIFILGWSNLAFSELVIFFVALRRISPHISMVGTSLANLSKEKKNIDVVYEILNRWPTEQSGIEEIQNIQQITLDNIRFSYGRDSNFNLYNINLLFKRGEVSAIVGRTGSGKSTLIHLLMGFYQTFSGNIYINHTNLKKLNLDTFRKKIGLVSQDIFLFNSTIKENITLFDDEVSDEKVINVAQMAQLHQDIQTFSKGYETIVGDRGIKLSGGQAQRVAIARAILYQPDILIFDEATSALDTLTEREIYNVIHQLSKKCIVIIIAHRLSTIKNANQIVVLDSGKIVEQGTHDVLIQANAAYSKFFQGEKERKNEISPSV